MTALNFPSSPTNGQTYQDYIFDGTKEVWRRSPELVSFSIDDLTDVTTSLPIAGNALVYDGSEWVNGESSGGFEQHFLLMGA